ncbi:hypothetical protein GDO78_009192 [Eleutherodactylus coqui]|uniref:Choline transporter-like protein n=1 Tax=Eleutherodactylus coqui TaxID=57060 RepID=A0A8J6F8P9_ELECQ|nr:hypothetical protein GDO78_009192 [Eleutherodactylus coqui]
MQIRDLRINSTALCVSSCPQEPLTSLQDLQRFAKNNGSHLCAYKLNYTEYTNHPKASEWCPVLPVPPSKSFPLFNRCVPQNPECYSKFASVLIDVINEVDFFHRILSGIMAGRDNVVGLSVLAVALSVVMVISFRYINTLLVHIFVTLLMFGLLSLIVLILVTFLMRKRLQMTIELFQVASRFIRHIPLLMLQPLWTFLILLFYWILWVAVLLSMGTSGSAQVSSDGQVEYKPLAGIRYMWWYHLFGLIWTSEFFLTCQQIAISGATVTWYLQRDKKKVKHPILSSLSVLFWYHLGTAIMGSLLLMLVRIPQIILMYLTKLLSKLDNACTRCSAQCCSCCLWSYGKWLRCLNQTLIHQSSSDPEMLKNRPVQNGEDGTELRPIARAD